MVHKTFRKNDLLLDFESSLEKEFDVSQWQDGKNNWGGAEYKRSKLK